MSCGSCGTTSNGLPKGCKNNGACGIDSNCGKLPVFDWLSNMRLPNGQFEFNCVEVRFKNERKHYFKNSNNLSLGIGDVVAVEAQSGHDIGVVTLTGELVRIQMKKRNLTENSEDVKKIYRKANEKDIETWQSFREKEQETKMKARRIAVNLGLEMKITDVEYQGDGIKAIFYYTAEGRVDFRELIKQFAGAFGVRIEMKQIGYRQEAAKVGGIGSCGRELCCSTWLTDFRSVNTAAARYQQLSINPQKLAGQCGKLKCCLNYELDSYLDALEEFPSLESTFDTEKGKAACMKIDVFKKEMWFTYESGGINWYKFSVEDVKEYISISKQNGRTAPLEDLVKETVEEKKEFVDVIQENSLERFERKNRNSKNKKNRNRTDKPKNQNEKSASPQKEKTNRPDRPKPNRSDNPQQEKKRFSDKNKPVNKQNSPKQNMANTNSPKPNPPKPNSPKPNSQKQNNPKPNSNSNRPPQNKKNNNSNRNRNKPDNPNKNDEKQ